MNFDHIILEPEQKELFIRIVEARRECPRGKWDVIFMIKGFSDLVITAKECNDIRIDNIAPGDIDELVHKGLLMVLNETASEKHFSIPGEGFQYYDWLVLQQDEIASKITSYSFNPDHVNPKIKDVIKQIENLKRELDRLLPIKEEYKTNLLKKVLLEWTFHSCKLEGNELTYGETRELLEFGQGSKRPYKHQREIKGHEEAVHYVENIAESNGPFSERFIRELNLKVLKEPYTIQAQTPDGKPTTKTIYPGEYKTTPNHIKTKAGDIFEFAEPYEVPPRMQKLIAWFNNEEELHPLVKAAELHYRFIRIHPFDDGNGRVSRLIMNYCLMTNGLPPIVVKSDQKDLYYSSLRKADVGEFEALYEFLGNSLADSLKLYISAAKGEDINEYSDLFKRLKVFDKKLSQDTKDEIRLKRSEEVLTQRFDDSIWPFFVSIIDSTKKFYRYFADHELHYMVDRTHFTGNFPISEIKEKLREAIAEIEHLRELGIEIRLIAFKSVPENPLDLFLKTKIEFQDYLYIHNPHHLNGNQKLPQIKKLYDKPVTEKEIQDYIFEDGNSILEKLESYYNSFGSEKTN